MKKLLLVSLVMLSAPIFAVKNTQDEELIASARNYLLKRSRELKIKHARMYAQNPVAFARDVAEYNAIYGRRFGLTTVAALTGNVMTMPQTPIATAQPDYANCLTPIAKAAVTFSTPGDASPIATARSYPALSPISMMERAAQELDAEDAQPGKVRTIVLTLVDNRFVRSVEYL